MVLLGIYFLVGALFTTLSVFLELKFCGFIDMDTVAAHWAVFFLWPVAVPAVTLFVIAEYATPWAVNKMNDWWRDRQKVDR